MYSGSQPGGWERVPRGSASCQERGGGASENGFPAWKLEQALYLNLVPFGSVPATDSINQKFRLQIKIGVRIAILTPDFFILEEHT
ncbi:hypothetical protein [Nostoc sp. PCC 9305]|uniref:hypothetical protein n=1 Tax=Nostoc sp. PCC 9305 TaxID=296636 RepID=UPI0039C6E181